VLVHVLADAQAVSRRAAEIVAELVARNPHPVIGLAAGATPVGTYGELARRHGDGLALAHVTAFGLDEYLGIGPEHPSSCAWTFRRHLIGRTDIDPGRVHLLDGTRTGDLTDYCAAYERAIAGAGGLDLQILGLGVNGHLGFNEPGSGFSSRTRRVALSASTRTTNRGVFPGEEVPREALTMGLGTILGARRVLLLATGPAKADMVAKAIEGSLTAMVPASALQMHADAVVLLDEAAAAGLTRRTDYDAEVAILARR
jgi:glucosamine-6-phosphate deaminase